MPRDACVYLLWLHERKEKIQKLRGERSKGSKKKKSIKIRDWQIHLFIYVKKLIKNKNKKFLFFWLGREGFTGSFTHGLAWHIIILKCLARLFLLRQASLPAYMILMGLTSLDHLDHKGDYLTQAWLIKVPSRPNRYLRKTLNHKLWGWKVWAASGYYSYPFVTTGNEVSVQRIAQKDSQCVERKREREIKGKGGERSDDIIWEPGYSWARNYFTLWFLNYYPNY